MDIENVETVWHIILDIDGVLITTPMWKPDKMHADGYSDFCEKCVQNLNKLTEGRNTEIIVSSSRRKGKTLDQLKTIFLNRGIAAPVTGMLPQNEISGHRNRREEILYYVESNSLDHSIIIDDDLSLHELPMSLKHRCVLTTYAVGFDEKALDTAMLMLATG